MLLTRLCLVMYVAFLSLAESDRCTLRQKHSDCAEDWVICELCVRQARPNPFFGSTSSRTTTAATTATNTATSSATTTATRDVPVKPVKPVKPLRKAKKEKTLKNITVDDCDTLCLRVHYPAGEWLDSKICGTQLFFCCLRLCPMHVMCTFNAEKAPEKAPEAPEKAPEKVPGVGIEPMNPQLGVHACTSSGVTCLC